MCIDFDISEVVSVDFGDESFSVNELGNDGVGSILKIVKLLIEFEVLVLNVRMLEGEFILGVVLLFMLLILGFKFGD